MSQEIQDKWASALEEAGAGQYIVNCKLPTLEMGNFHKAIPHLGNFNIHLKSFT